MRGRLILSASASLVLAALALGFAGQACNNVIIPGEPGTGGEGGMGSSGRSSSSGMRPDAGKDALSDFVDPGCPNKPPPIKDLQCDPYNQNDGSCFFDEGCYIFVEYPPEPCGQEIYGARCLPAGPGGQGDPCQGALDCGSGHACVVTGAGTQCVQLCPLEGNDGCPQGMVCEPIDVEGFGGCL